MGMSERDARGPEEHEHLFVVGGASFSLFLHRMTRPWSDAPPANLT